MDSPCPAYQLQNRTALEKCVYVLCVCVHVCACGACVRVCMWCVCACVHVVCVCVCMCVCDTHKEQLKTQLKVFLIVLYVFSYR